MISYSYKGWYLKDVRKIFRFLGPPPCPHFTQFGDLRWDLSGPISGSKQPHMKQQQIWDLCSQQEKCPKSPQPIAVSRMQCLLCLSNRVEHTFFWLRSKCSICSYQLKVENTHWTFTCCIWLDDFRLIRNKIISLQSQLIRNFRILPINAVTTELLQKFIMEKRKC